MMALAKSLEAIDEWAVITAGDIRKGAEMDVSGLHGVIVSIVVAPVEAVAHANGVLVTVQRRVGANDEDWRDVVSFRSSSGTANTIDVDAQSASGQTQLKVSLTANFETKNDVCFVKDNTIANSEIVRNNGFASDDYIICLDDLTLTHENTADVYDIVDQFHAQIPWPSSTVRVLYWNDDADCDVVTRSDLEKAVA